MCLELRQVACILLLCAQAANLSLLTTQVSESGISEHSSRLQQNTSSTAMWASSSGLDIASCCTGEEGSPTSKGTGDRHSRSGVGGSSRMCCTRAASSWSCASRVRLLRGLGAVGGGQVPGGGSDAGVGNADGQRGCDVGSGLNWQWAAMSSTLAPSSPLSAWAGRACCHSGSPVV